MRITIPQQDDGSAEIQSGKEGESICIASVSTIPLIFLTVMVVGQNRLAVLQR